MTAKQLNQMACGVATMVLLVGSMQSTMAAVPLGSAWTYQGKLNLSGSPLNDTADFEFTLWDADAAGNMIGSVVAVSDVAIVDGLFTAELDFGVLAFNGDARWLEIDVRSPAGVGDFTTLSPRQPLTANPYSLQTRGLFVDDAGNVGIGTEPEVGQALDVNGLTTIRGSNTHLKSGATFGTRLFINNDSSGENFRWLVETTGVSDAPGPGHFTIEEDLAPRMLIQAGGNVGIGTEFPSAKPDVVGTTEFNGDVSINGNVAADGFVGDGSSLTGLSVSPVDYGLIGMLRWDRLLNSTFPTGLSAASVVFDGANVWVTNVSTVTKLRASDGANLGTFPVGSFASGVAFDGANVWVANSGSSTVTRISLVR